MNYTFKKSTCERYDLRFERGGWAIFTIDENGGMFNCQSDFGTYAYSWPNHGMSSFKHFIIELSEDPHYFLKKVAKENYFNFEKNFKNWVKEIVDVRKEHECTKEEARNAFDFLKGLEEYSNIPDVILHQMYSTRELDGISDEPWYIFEFEKDYSPDAYNFSKVIMPMFAEVLRNEIKNELLEVL